MTDLPQYIVRPRSSGKSHVLEQWVRDAPEGVTRKILVHTRMNAESLMRVDRRLLGKVVWVSDLPRLRGMHSIEFAIDNAEDLLLNGVYLPPGSRVVAMTFTGSTALERADLLRWVLEHLDSPDQIREAMEQAEAEAAAFVQPYMLPLEGI